jgi:hypothetical protein
MMKKALTAENLPDVAEALNMPRDATRASVLQRARELKGMGGKSGLFLPFAAGSIAYGLSSRESRAGDGADAGPSTGDKLTAAGAAAGTAYGASKVANALPFVGRALNFIGERSGPMMLSDMATDLGRYLTDKGIMRSPDQRVADLSGASEVPSPNPLRTEPSPGNQYYPLSSPLMERRAEPSPTAADQDVGRAWAKSPRATVIELTRGSGLDPEDIAHLAGVSPDEVHSVLQGIPQGALQAR